MKITKGLHIKGKMMLVLLFFSLFAFGSLVFTFIKSSRIDRENVQIIEVGEKVKIDVLQARIILDEYKLERDTTLYPEIFANFTLARKNIESLEQMIHLADKKVVDDLHQRLIKNVSQILDKINTLENLIKAQNQVDDRMILEAYHQFTRSFNAFELALHDYVSDRNANFGKTVYFLLIASFLILLVCLLIIANLVNALLRAERIVIRKTVEIEQKERHRISRELHDGLGALLSSIGIYANILDRETKDNQEVNEKLKEIRSLSNSALQTVQEIINNLNPSVLSKHGLAISLEKLCERMNQLGKVTFRLNTANYNIILPQGTKVILYRVCTELINNTLKHSQASAAHIKLYNKKNTIFLNYADNGIGFDSSNKELQEGEKMGLRNLRSRIDALGGHCKIESAPNQGINISVQINCIP
ncbi:MAG: sensor histidine kinase [Marinifilaceae bacterium]